MNEKIFNTLKNFEKERTNWLKLMNEKGGYIVVPTSELLAIATTYYTNHADIIRDNLIKDNVSEDIIEAVINDYSAALVGQFKISLTPEQMIELLKKVRPYKAYFWDKYVLYWGLMKFYIGALDLLREYTKVFKSSDTTIDAKNTFIEKHNTLDDAICLKFLKDIECIKITDFEGIDRQKIINWLDDMDILADFCKYAEYYTISSLAFNATDEQLKAIHPPIPKAVEIAQKYTNEIRNFLNNQADKMAQYIEADNIADREKIKKEVDNWEKKTSNDPPYVIGHNIAIMQSRDLYTSTDAKARDILPITAHIDDYMTIHGYDKKISSLIVEKAVMGINLLQRIHQEKIQNGHYTFHTTISEFANVSYGWDANEEEKMEMLHALKILHNVYIVVWRPTGRVAIQLVALKEIGLSDDEKGKITIEVTAEAMTGDERPISASDFKKLQQASKGQAQNHFNGQILSKGNKGHKREEDLLDEVFGYTFKIDEARMHNATDSDIRLIQRKIAKNKTNNRKQLLRMFERAQADGLITFTTRKGKDGKTVYEWVSHIHAKEKEEVQL